MTPPGAKDLTSSTQSSKAQVTEALPLIQALELSHSNDPRRRYNPAPGEASSSIPLHAGSLARWKEVHSRSLLSCSINRRTITTSYAYPITFNCVSTPKSKRPCHWCDLDAYGVLGLGCRRVEVLQYIDTKRNEHGVYEEIAGGHTSKGAGPSRMCYKCTTDRALVLCCSNHTLEPIAGISPLHFNYERAYDRLLSQQNTGVHWCSICLSPAFYKCTTPFTPKAGDDAHFISCGLRVCGQCKEVLMNDFHGNLQALLKKQELGNCDGDKTYPLGLRADAEFLLEDGLLMQALRKSSIDRGIVQG